MIDVPSKVLKMMGLGNCDAVWPNSDWSLGLTLRRIRWMLALDCSWLLYYAMMLLGTNIGIVSKAGFYSARRRGGAHYGYYGMDDIYGWFQRGELHDAQP